MGSSKFSHPLSKISVFGVRAVLAICILSVSVQNAATKSIIAVFPSVDDVTSENTDQPSSSSPPPSGSTTTMESGPSGSTTATESGPSGSTTTTEPGSCPDGYFDCNGDNCPSRCCQRLCLTWNYVLTSLAIAVLFIITPTAIVFALFHRRNVALERARLIRLAQTRMADLRGEFTRDDPINDLPPSYEEVLDIKVPPPCFCQAVAMEQPREESLEDCSCKTIAEGGNNESNPESSMESSTEVGVDAAKEITRRSQNCDTGDK